nr:MAG TPA: hypothetical protein [Caudoviricetes sp.]
MWFVGRKIIFRPQRFIKSDESNSEWSYAYIYRWL